MLDIYPILYLNSIAEVAVVIAIGAGRGFPVIFDNVQY